MKGKLPTSWQYAKLGECCSIVSGATPRRDVSEYWSNEIPWVTPKDLSAMKGAILEDTPEYISKKGYQNCSTTLLPKGSILFSSRAPIGLVAITGREMCTNQGFKSLVPSPDVHSEYLYYCMKWMSPQIADMGNGATFKEVSKETVSRVEIPLPPLAEQRRIANILYKANVILNKQQQTIKLSDDFLQSMFLDMFGDPIANPKGWKVKNLEEIILRKNGLVDGPFGSAVNTKIDYVLDGEIPVIRTKNVGRFTFIPEDLKFMTREKYKTVIRSKVVPGDIVLTKVGTIGNVCIFPDIYKEAVLSTTGSCRIRPDKSVINSIYLLHYLDLYKKEMHRIASQGVQPFLSLKHIKEFRVPVPPISLQKQFMSIETQQNKLNKYLIKGLRGYEILLNSLTQRAFKGKL